MGAGSLQLPVGCAVWGAARGTAGVVVPPPGAGAARVRSGTTSPGGPCAGNGPWGAGRGGPAGAALGGQSGDGGEPGGLGRRAAGLGDIGCIPSQRAGPCPSAPGPSAEPLGRPLPRPRPAGCCGRCSGSRNPSGRSKKGRGRRLWHCPGRAGRLQGLAWVGICHCCLSHPHKHPVPCAYTPAATLPISHILSLGPG